jgi:hypothetical protein
MKKIIKKYNRKKTADKAVRKTAKRPAANKPDKGEKFPHFRWYRKSAHPALVVGERIVTDEYDFKKVTSSEYEGRHLNDKIIPNPDKSKETPMYIVKRVRHDKKKNFSKDKLPWKYPKK